MLVNVGMLTFGGSIFGEGSYSESRYLCYKSLGVAIISKLFKEGVPVYHGAISRTGSRGLKFYFA